MATNSASASSTKFEFKATELSVSIQKKLFGRMLAKKAVAKRLIDDHSASLLDSLHRIVKMFLAEGGKCEVKEPEKVVKRLIKIIIKLGILSLNDQFTESDHALTSQLQRTLRTLLMSVVSFHEVDFSYDQSYLIDSLNTCRSLLKQLIQDHLSDKSSGRVDQIFDLFTTPELLDRVFTTVERDDSFYEVKYELVREINAILEHARKRR